MSSVNLRQHNMAVEIIPTVIYWQQIVLILAVLLIFWLKGSWFSFKIYWTEYPFILYMLYMQNIFISSGSGPPDV